jgi:glycosyltransferase involved in cell wall biosynthesis
MIPRERKPMFSVVIPTYNRAGDLIESLDSMRGIASSHPWELIVVDNNSKDDTKLVVEESAKTFPVPLHYLFEPEQGRCAALNAGIRSARGEIILTTDDDVRVEEDWLDKAAAALNSLGCHYISGKVLPIWQGVRPKWIPESPGRLWAVIALLDYGPEPVEFGQKYVPIGVNMAFRRSCFETAGLWDNRLGRKAGTLLGQEVREWTTRARAEGLKGFYSPDFVIHHCIPADRLNKEYFRRWYYWHGVSRALLYEQFGLDMEAPEAAGMDVSKVPHILGVPRYLYRTCINAAGKMARATLQRDVLGAFEHELWLWFFAGILKQRFKEHRRPSGLQQIRSAEPKRPN